jgi:hypothetical protein
MERIHRRPNEKQGVLTAFAYSGFNRSRVSGFAKIKHDRVIAEGIKCFFDNLCHVFCTSGR